MKRLLKGIAIAVAGTLVFPYLVALAYTWYIDITITETSGNSYTDLALYGTVNNTYLASEGYIAATGLNTRVYAADNSTLPHMLTDDKIFFVTDVPASSTQTVRYTTGEPVLSSFDIIPGYAGYITASDNATLEPAGNFTVEIDGLVDLSTTGANFTAKDGAIQIYTSGSTNITAEITGGPSVTADNVSEGEHAITVSGQGVVGAPWLTDYDYRREITITGSTNGTQTNYQIPFDIYYNQDTGPVTTLTTSTSDFPISDPFQHHILYMAGLLWIFYSDGTNLVWVTSSDAGRTFSSATTLRAAGSTVSSDFYFDGTRVHYVFCRSFSGDDVFYRRGTPNSDGTITWDSAEVTVLAVAAGTSVYYPSITVDSGGYPWIGYTDGPDPAQYPRNAKVTKSSTNDGTWSTQAGFPVTLQSSYTTFYPTVLVFPLTASKVYVAYVGSSAPNYPYGNLWTGAAWTGEEQITNYGWGNGFAGVADGDDVHLVEMPGSSIRYIKRTYGVGWGAVTTISTNGNTLPGVTYTGSNSLIAIYGKTSTDHIYYRELVSGTWQTEVDWLDLSADGLGGPLGTENFGVLDESSGPLKSFIAQQTKAAAPYDIETAGIYTTSGRTIVYDGKVQTDFDDIRFTSDNGSGELDYWLESKTDSEYGKVWPEFNSITASPATTIFYTYYGNAAASSSSNGTATFPFFDDFPGAALDAAKWTASGTGTVTVAGGTATVAGPVGGGSWETIIGTSNQTYGAIRLRLSATNNNFENWGWSIDQSGTNGAYWQWNYTPAYTFNTWRGGSNNTTSGLTGVSGQTYLWDITWEPGEIKGYRDGSLQATHTGALPNAGIPIMIGSQSSNSSVVVDWALIRNWVDPEPTVTAWGDEEHPSLTISIDGVEKDSATWTSGNVTDNGNEWEFGYYGALRYANYYRIDVGGVTKLLYQPDSIIVGTTLPDESGTGNPGTFHWGTIPSGVTVVVGPLTSNLPTSTPTTGTAPWVLVQPTETTEPAGLFTEGGECMLGITELANASEATGNPRAMFPIMFAFLLALLFGFGVYGATHNTRMGQRGSLFLQSITSLAVLIFFYVGGCGVIPGWVLIPFGLESLFFLVGRNPQHSST